MAKSEIFIEEIESVESTNNNVICKVGEDKLILKNKQIKIKLGDESVKTTTYEFMRAFADMLDEEIFEMDVIREKFWGLENTIEEVREQRDSAREMLLERR